MPRNRLFRYMAPQGVVALRYFQEMASDFFATSHQKSPFCNFLLLYITACLGIFICFAEYLSKEKLMSTELNLS